MLGIEHKLAHIAAIEANVLAVSCGGVADGKLRIAGGRMVPKKKYSVKVSSRPNIMLYGCPLFPRISVTYSRHRERVDVGGVAMAILYDNSGRSGGMSRLADCDDFVCHLLCIPLVTDSFL